MKRQRTQAEFRHFAAGFLAGYQFGVEQEQRERRDEWLKVFGLEPTPPKRKAKAS